MRLHALMHSGFMLELPTQLLVFDYWHDASKILADFSLDKRPIYFFVSHEHRDHFNPKFLQLAFAGSRTVVMPPTCLQILTEEQRLQLGSYYLPQLGANSLPALRFWSFPSTDLGYCYLVETTAGLVFHAGDLNDWDWQDEDSATMTTEFRRIVALIKSTLLTEGNSARIKLAFFPCDPNLASTALQGAEHFLSELQPAYFQAMHCKALNFRRSLAADYARLQAKFPSCTLLPVCERGQRYDF